MADKAYELLAAQLTTSIDNMTFLSGTPIITILDNQRIYIEQYTGQSVGSPVIAEKYQPAMLDLARAEIMQLLDLQGGDFSDVRIGDFSIKKGSNSNTSDASAYFKQMGEQKLKNLGRKINFARVIGA
jgi:hypothetical protein